MAEVERNADDPRDHRTGDDDRARTPKEPQRPTPDEVTDPDGTPKENPSG